jgi:hypothetical protein
MNTERKERKKKKKIKKRIPALCNVINFATTGLYMQ